MGQQKDDQIAYGCVYKVNMPDGNICVGRDTSATAEWNWFTYFGTMSLGVKKEIAANIGNAKSITISKYLLYEARDCTVGHILDEERKFIVLLNAKTPSIGYNRS